MEFGFESLHQRRLHGKLFCLFKIINNQSPTYLFQLVPLPNTGYVVQNSTILKTPVFSGL